MQPDYTSLQEVLEWLAGIGGPYIVGAVLALLVENWKQWHTLPHWVKFLAPLAASILVSIGAVLLMRQTEFVSQASPWFRLIAQAVITYLGSQQAYMQAKSKCYASFAQPSGKNCQCKDNNDVQ